jgi:zinc transport system substrate-binding protein
MKWVYPILFFILATSCSPQGGRGTAVEKKPVVFVSIPPYQFFAKRVAGGEIDVRTIVPAGANPHSYEPTAKQVAEASEGAIWFQIGEGFEKRLQQAVSHANPAQRFVDLREGIELIEEEEFHCSHCSMDHFDRHVWLSPREAARQVQAIVGALSEAFPERRGTFEENGAQLIDELAALDREIGALLAEGAGKRVFVVSHPAFGYFCRDYACSQLSIEYEGKDPRPKHLEAVLESAEQLGAQVAIALPQYNNRGAQRVAQELHVPVQMVDPYSTDYFGTMRKLAQLVASPRGEEP